MPTPKDWTVLTVLGVVSALAVHSMLQGQADQSEIKGALDRLHPLIERSEQHLEAATATLDVIVHQTGTGRIEAEWETAAGVLVRVTAIRGENESVEDYERRFTSVFEVIESQHRKEN